MFSSFRRKREQTDANTITIYKFQITGLYVNTLTKYNERRNIWIYLR